MQAKQHARQEEQQARQKEQKGRTQKEDCHSHRMAATRKLAFALEAILLTKQHRHEHGREEQLQAPVMRSVLYQPLNFKAKATQQVMTMHIKPDQRPNLSFWFAILQRAAARLRRVSATACLARSSASAARTDSPRTTTSTTTNT